MFTDPNGQEPVGTIPSDPNAAAIFYNRRKRSAKNSCECPARAPDFVNFQFDYGVGSFWGTFSRSGNTFLGAGVNRSYPNPVSASGTVTVGWLNSSCAPSRDDVDNFLGGYAGGAAGAYGVLGGGMIWSPGNGTASVVGVGAGVQAGSASSGTGSFGFGYSVMQGQTPMGGW
jgi:filamentous hemagglutinin